jgi:LCP family protein required for cell wall assembly
VYFTLNGNIESVDINGRLRDDDRPRNVDNGSLDILVLGSDTRAGANGEYGRDEGTARSDTAMILHVFEGHKKAAVVSVPRDTIVERPDCTDRTGAAVPGQRKAMFNTAYERGGPACAVKTVEKMSGIRMDHYIEVDFTGFKKLIDELGGVEITTTKPIKDKSSHLDLAAGPHTLTGEQALGLVRTRKGVGDGSDLGRIQLQQAFMKAFIEQARSVGVFTNPKKLWDLADTATRAIKPDSELDSVKELADFAGGLEQLGPNDVDMITMPVRYDPADLNRVIPLPAQSQQVWAALKADRPIPASATRDTAEGQADGVVK